MVEPEEEEKPATPPPRMVEKPVEVTRPKTVGARVGRNYGRTKIIPKFDPTEFSLEAAVPQRQVNLKAMQQEKVRLRKKLRILQAELSHYS